jgi:ornithine carbamoyltransferase
MSVINKTRLRGRSLLTLDELSVADLTALVDLAADLKARKRAGVRGDLLLRKNIALIFEKSSTRTRCAFTVAAADEGAQAEYLDVHDIHLGKKESIVDTARVLGRMFDGIAFRGFKQSTVETLARCAGVPVWNALTDDWHPTQVLADLLTLREQFGALQGLRMVYVGDGRNNMVNTLMIGCAMVGMHFVNCAPAVLAPDPALVARAAALALRNGGSLTVTTDPLEGVRGAHAIYTDVWVSMGEEAQFEERVRLLKPYRIDRAMVERTGNLESGRFIFLHCLPGFHNRDTEVTRTIGELEVTDEVFEAPYSKVFEQAENRMHTIKALMVATLT